MSFLTNLESYWPLSESSGTRVDLHRTTLGLIDPNNLADNATVTGGTIGSYPASDFEASQSEFLSIADNPSLSLGDISFSIGGLIQLETAGACTLCCKASAATVGNNEWIFQLQAAARLFVRISNGVSGAAAITANTSLTAGPVYHVGFSHDAAADTVDIFLNGVSDLAAPVAYANGSHDSVKSLIFGSLNGTSSFLDGLMAHWFFYKNRALTAAEWAQIYNGGSILTYHDFYQLPRLERKTRGINRGILLGAR